MASKATPAEQRKQIIQSLLPFLFLLVADVILVLVNHQLTRFIAGFTLSVLVAQIVYQIVFLKGQICPGQRGRLSKVNLYTLAYWLPILAYGFISRSNYTPQALMILAAILLLFTAWHQPKEQQLREGMLKIGTIAGGFALLFYIVIFFAIGSIEWLIYNPFTQILTCLLLAYWGLTVSRSRLGNFIALLPPLMLILLPINAIFCVIALAIAHYSGYVLEINLIAFAIYFILHFVLFIMLWHSVNRKEPLQLSKLAVMLLISCIMPLLMV